MRKSLVALAVVLSIVGNVSGGLYTVTDLGGGIAYGLNASGQVVGIGYGPTAPDGHAFLWSNGTSTDLGTLGGPQSIAYSINASGQVVDFADTASLQPNSTLYVTNAFLYSNGTMTNLTPGAVSPGALGINASGHVAGWYSNYGTTAAGGALGPTQPFLYSNGTRNNLGSFPSGSATYPIGINDSGTVVGYTYQLGITGMQPFLIQNGTTTILNIAGDLQAINNSGQAVGGQYTSGTTWHAISYSNGTITSLGTLGGSTSWAYGINSAGQIVGDSATASGADHAFIDSNGTMTDLNTLIDPHSGWTLEQAFAINDRGQIVGWGTNASGRGDAFLLSPASAVPEPPSVTLLGLGAIVALGHACGRRKAVAM